MRWVSELGTGSHEEIPYIPNHDEEPQTITGSKDAMQSGPWPESLIYLHGHSDPPKLSIYKYPELFVADSGEGQEILQSNWHPIFHTKLLFG